MYTQAFADSEISGSVKQIDPFATRRINNLRTIPYYMFKTRDCVAIK